MKSCTACKFSSTCSTPCSRVESLLHPDFSTGLMELSLGSIIHAVPSSQAFAPDSTPLPVLQDLRPIELKMLELFYQDGFSYKKIGRRTKKKINTVKITLARAKKKLVPLSTISRGILDND